MAAFATMSSPIVAFLSWLAAFAWTLALELPGYGALLARPAQPGR